MSTNDYRTLQSIDSTETYGYGTSKDLICSKEEIKCKSLMKEYKND